MKPPPFVYHRPRSLSEAFDCLRTLDGDVKLLAGGQSLVPMLNFRLARPDHLVDLNDLTELDYVRVGEATIEIGALARHHRLATDPQIRAALPLLAHGAASIGHYAIRRRGTLGGSLSHADPSADWVASLAAIGARVLIRGPAGQRSLAIEDFVTGAFEVALDPGEILEAVRIPRLSRSARWGFYKICRKTGELAQAIGAVLHDPERSVFRAVIGAMESRPIVLSDAASLFGGKPRAGLPAAFDPGAAARVLSAAGMTDPFDNQIHVVALKRAIDQADLA